MNGLTQSLQSFIWGYEVDRLDRVTSVVYLVGMGVDCLVDTFTLVIYLGGMEVDSLDTVTSVVYLGV